MRIALVQSDIEWESKKVNHRYAEEFIEQAAHEGCDIVVFPEMFNTGFSMNITTIAEVEEGETDLILSKLAIKHNIYVIAGYAVKIPGSERGKNQAVVFNRTGKLVARYTKMHSFSFAREDEYYAAGDKVVTFDIDGMASSIFICFDLRFPEVFRKIARDVQAVFVIANWPSSRVEHWEVLLRARAIENQCFVIGVNRYGRDGNGIYYSGHSKIFDSQGNEICSGDEAEELVIGEIVPEEVNELRQKFPFLKSMRTL